MLLYYADRPVLFNVPPRFQLPADARFNVTFGPGGGTTGDGLIFLPAANATIADHAPMDRSAIPFVRTIVRPRSMDAPQCRHYGARRLASPGRD